MADLYVLIKQFTNMNEKPVFKVLTENEWNALMDVILGINKKLERLTSQQELTAVGMNRHLTALEFMEVCRIQRSKFDSLVKQNLIEIKKVGRKIYVPAKEIEKYFELGIEHIL